MGSFAFARPGRLLPAVIILFALGGCGIKGPLYIPTPPAKPAPPQQAPADHNKADPKDSAT